MPESTRIGVFKTDELDGAARNAIIELCAAAHQEEDFRNLFAYVPSGGTHFLAFLGEEVVSHALVTTRWLQPEGQALLKTAYVDAVATSLAHQGQGHGSRLMRRLASSIDSEHVIACLETERVEFFERLGWELWRGPLAGRGEAGLILTPEQRGIMILRLSQTPVLDVHSMLTIECQDKRIW